MDAVDKLVQVPPLFIDAPTQPLPIIPLEVTKAEVVPGKSLALMKLTPARDIPIPPAEIANAHKNAWIAHRAALARSETSSSPAFTFGSTYLQSGGLVLIALLSLAPFVVPFVVSFVGAGRLDLRWLISLNMLSVLVAAFLLLALLTSYAQQQWILAVLLFLSFCGVFKLLSRFESVS